MATQTIMIIDDDADIRQVLELILKDAGFAVRIGKDVTDLYEVEKNPPDLILLDNWLDGKTGHDICLHLKQIPKTAGIPVILISAGRQLAQTAESCRADGFMAKPFEIGELLLKIRYFIG